MDKFLDKVTETSLSCFGFLMSGDSEQEKREIIRRTAEIAHTKISNFDSSQTI